MRVRRGPRGQAFVGQGRAGAPPLRRTARGAAPGAFHASQGGASVPCGGAHCCAAFYVLGVVSLQVSLFLNNTCGLFLSRMLYGHDLLAR